MPINTALKFTYAKEDTSAMVYQNHRLNKGFVIQILLMISQLVLLLSPVILY